MEQLLGRLLDLLLLPLRHLLRLKVLLPPLLPLLLLHLTDLQLQRSLLLHQHALLFLQLAKIALQLAMGLLQLAMGLLEHRAPCLQSIELLLL